MRRLGRGLRKGLGMKWITLVAFVVVGLISFWFVANSRAATESPEYEVGQKDGRFEIRDYPEMKLASATTKGGAENGNFMTLFRYFDGGNEDSEKIAMTTPVLMERESEKGSMSFIVPASVAESGAPNPKSDKVTIRTTEKARYAVMRFSRKGTQAADEAAAIEKLTAWMDAEQLEPKGRPLIAYYDPPWTPFFMRRNEVLVPVASS